MIGGWESTFQWCCVQVVKYTRVHDVYPCPCSPSAEPHGGANKASAPPLMDETVEKEVHPCFHATPLLLHYVLLRQLESSTTAQFHCVCVCVFTNAHSMEEEEKEEKEGC